MLFTWIESDINFLFSHHFFFCHFEDCEARFSAIGYRQAENRRIKKKIVKIRLILNIKRVYSLLDGRRIPRRRDKGMWSECSHISLYCFAAGTIWTYFTSSPASRNAFYYSFILFKRENCGYCWCSCHSIRFRQKKIAT